MRTSERAKRRRSRKKQQRHTETVFGSLFFTLLGCCFLSLSLTAILHTQTPHHNKSLLASRSRYENQDRPLAGLSCEAYGGPADPSEIVYWRDIPSDRQFVSPLKQTDERQFMTFEPDRGGFNNVRMAFETVATLAHAMGRILVLPPEQEMYLLDDRKGFGFQDFFPIHQMAMEQSGLDIISTEEFLREQALTGRLKDRHGRVSFPPHNISNWNGKTETILEVLHPWLRSIATMPQWNPVECLAVFPASRDPANVHNLEVLWSNTLSNGGFPRIEKYFDHPTPVDASFVDRLGENRAGRENLCIYNTTLQDATLLHFHGKPKLGGRLLTHFYSFLVFEDWKQDVWTKRFVRDYMRYKDEIQCAAARIVQAVRQRGGQQDQYDAFHVRRGEFQYKKTRVSAAEMYDIAKQQIPDGSTVYIATDERDKDFFADLAAHYHLLFLDDFLDLIPDLNTNFYGMIDQLVASRSRIFFGCWFSTFTGYINRLRGYHADQLKLKGSDLGKIDSYYYAPALNKERMRGYWPLTGSLYAREFPVSWRDIDKGVAELGS